MRSTRQLRITLPTETVERIEKRIASGDYADESDVIHEGLRALDDRDAVIEKWLREEVAPTYDAYKAGLEPTSSLEEVMERLSKHMDEAAQKAS